MEERPDDFDDTVIVTGERVPVPDSIALEDTVLVAPPRPTARPSTTPRISPAPVVAPADGWWTIRIAGHEPILLDVPTVIGRQPTTPRIAAGPVPRLVRVPSPSREVSSSHVRIELSGQSVVVTDLSSTNGTRLLNPDSPALMLRRGESGVALPGSLVDLGDDVLIEIDYRAEAPG